MKIRLLSVLIGLSLSHNVVAQTPRPHACPALAVIQSIQFQHAFYDSSWGWMTSATDNFSTPERWTFIMMNTDAQDEQGALELGNKNVKLFSYVEGPVKDSSVDMWMCIYSNENGNENEEVFGGSVTPPVDVEHASRILRQLKFKKA